MTRILIRRGLKSQLPSLNDGELGYCTDTEELFIGSTAGNVLLQSSQDVGGSIFVAKESFSGSANYVKTFSSPMDGLVISNDGNSDITFTISDQILKVGPGKISNENFFQFNKVSINTTVPYRAYGKKKITNIDKNGFVVIEPFSGSSNMTKTFSGTLRGFYIKNTGASDLTFTIDGESYKVKVGENFDEYFDSFTSVTITATDSFSAWGKGLPSENAAPADPS